MGASCFLSFVFGLLLVWLWLVVFVFGFRFSVLFWSLVVYTADRSRRPQTARIMRWGWGFGFRFSVFAISIPQLRTHAGVVAGSRLMRRDLHSICFSSALHTAARPGPRPRQRVWSAVNMGNRATFKAGCFGGCVLSVVFTTESTHHNPVSCARGKKINRHITLIYLLARDFNFKCLGLLTSGIGK